VIKLSSSLWRHIRRDHEEGQGLVEYAFILVLIAMVCLTILTVVAKQTNNLYSNISSALVH
jgi:Flp pilus assembly pilin Flp